MIESYITNLPCHFYVRNSRNAAAALWQHGRVKKAQECFKSTRFVHLPWDESVFWRNVPRGLSLVSTRDLFAYGGSDLWEPAVGWMTGLSQTADAAVLSRGLNCTTLKMHDFPKLSLWLQLMSRAGHDHVKQQTSQLQQKRRNMGKLVTIYSANEFSFQGLEYHSVGRRKLVGLLSGV